MGEPRDSKIGLAVLQDYVPAVVTADWMRRRWAHFAYWCGYRRYRVTASSNGGSGNRYQCCPLRWVPRPAGGVLSPRYNG